MNPIGVSSLYTVEEAEDTNDIGKCWSAVDTPTVIPLSFVL